jgi:hypothetical protein
MDTRAGQRTRRSLVRSSDVRVHDPLALDEIELYGEVVIAASASDGPLTVDEIDEVLGVSEPPGPPARRLS